MSEMLKTGGEKSAEGMGASHLEVLTEMSDKFDPDKARSLAEQDKLRSTEKLDDEARAERKASHLAVMPEKREKELSPEDAANEYLTLLDELSQDFSNPYYSEGRKGQTHHASTIARELGRKYSDNPHYRPRGYDGTEAGATDGTLNRIASADNILANEIGWRTEGEKAKQKAAQINERVDRNLTQLDADYANKGRLGKLFGKRKYEKARKKLEQSRSNVGIDARSHRQYNTNIAKELAISYNERGDYDYNGGGYGESQNEARNRQFFGLDDPERAAKVERAIELRQKYESEWSKKKQ